MALIECNECGAQISDKASVCPKCGNPLTPSATERAKIFFKSKLLTFFKSKLFIGIICLLTSLTLTTLVLFILEKGPFRFWIEGDDPQRYYLTRDYTNAYVELWIDWVPLVLIVLGIMLLWIAQALLFPRIKKLYFIIITTLIAVIGCSINYNNNKTSCESLLADCKFTQDSIMSQPDFEQKEAEVPKIAAGKKLLTQELKDCSSHNVKHLIGMTDSVAINYCNALNEFAIKTWDKPLTGLGVNVYQATYTNDYGNQVTDRFFVFFKDEKPIKFAKENIIKEWSTGEVLFLMLHNFE